MGIAGVVAIDRNPVEPGTEVGFHLLHQIAGGLAQVGQFNTLRGYDEAELVAVVTAAVEEGATVRPITVGDLALLAVPRDAVALEVAR